MASQEVEPMGKESDHIHISALTAATGISIQVEYLDRGSDDSIIGHVFPEGTTPQIYLLYKPGHYDILYKWKPHQDEVLQNILNLLDIS